MGETEPLKRSKSRLWLVVGIVVGAVLIDQLIKLYIATHFQLGESHEVFSWFWLCYIENNGMGVTAEYLKEKGIEVFNEDEIDSLLED